MERRSFIKRKSVDSEFLERALHEKSITLNETDAITNYIDNLDDIRRYT
jgi:hypothetical protein